MGKDFRVIYSINAPLGGVGIGTTAYYEVKNTDKEGLIKEIYCSGLQVGDLKSKIVSFKSLSYASLICRGIQKKIFPKFMADNLVSELFDILVSKRIKKADIFHGWNGFSLRSAKSAKKNGSLVFIEQASSHPANQRKILLEEYEKYGEDKSMLPSEKSIRKSQELFDLADYVLIPSDFVKDSFIREGFPPEKLIQIPFGVDVEKYAPSDKRDKTFRVIFVGSVQLRKGIQYLLQAWEELSLKNAELVIVGRVWPDARNAVAKYRENKSINFVGFEKDPKKYYSISDVSVFPSLEEGSALVSYEAMASGLPLIATYNTGSVMRDKKDGFIIPIRDVKALKEKIKYFYDHPEKARAMGKSARKHVEDFTWEDYGEKITQAYETALIKKKKIHNGK